MPRRTLGMSRDEYLDAVGEEIEPAGRKPAPRHLRTLQRFINTFNIEYPARDRLATASDATAWLAAHELLAATASLDEAARVTLVTVREALRSLALQNVGTAPDPHVERTLVEASRRAQLVIRPTGDGSRLEASAPGVDGAIGELLAQMHGAFADGSWARLKACRQCGYAFFDRSKNRSGEWCAMSVCGNRVKNRSYRARRSDP